MTNLIADHLWQNCDECGTESSVYWQQTTEEGEEKLGWTEKLECQACGSTIVYSISHTSAV